jgi:DNA helicase HerA-like ATPase
MVDFYELKPVNFFNLREEEQQAVISDFVRLVNSLSAPASFFITTAINEVPVRDLIIRQPYKRYFIASEENIDSVLASSDFRFVKVSGIPRLEIKDVVRNFMILKEGFARSFNAYALPKMLPYGFLTRIYDVSHEIRLDIQPTSNARIVEKQYRSLNEKVKMLGDRADPSLQLYLQSLEKARYNIASGLEKLFKIRLVITVKGANMKELHDKSIELLKAMDFLEGPNYVQDALYYLKPPSWAQGRWLYVTSSGIAPFFPFAGMDLIDPEGVFLGTNLFTGNAVIFDVFERENYNVSILGLTGYGKSLLLKVWLSRLAQKDDRVIMYIFDSLVKPEYALGADGTFETSLAKDISAQVFRFDQGDFPLDPFLVFESKRDAGEFIRTIAKIEEGSEEAIELYALSKKAKSVSDLISKADGNLKKRLEAELEPFMRFFTGKEMELYDRAVFVLSDIPSNFVRDGVAFLLLALVWSTVKQEQIRSRRKFIVVDEGWAFVETNPRTGKPFFPMAVEYIPEIARTGRHYGVSFILASQLVSDFASGPGRILIENSATKIILRQDSASLEKLNTMLNLSEDESKFILSSKPGYGIISTPEGKVPFYNYVLEDELARYITKPR